MNILSLYVVSHYVEIALALDHEILGQGFIEEKGVAANQSLDLVCDIRFLFVVNEKEDQVQAALAHAPELNDAVNAPVPVDVPFHHDLVLGCLDFDVLLFYFI